MEDFGIQNEHRHLLHFVNDTGMYYKREAGIGEWAYVTRWRGHVLSEWIDGFAQYAFLIDTERSVCDAALKHGYREGLRTAALRLDPLPEHLIEMMRTGPRDRRTAVGHTAAGLLHEMVRDAKDARIRHRWGNTMAFPLESNPRQAGLTVYPVNHWRHAAYLRGRDFAYRRVLDSWYSHGVIGDGQSLTELREVEIPSLIRDADQFREYAFPQYLFDSDLSYDPSVRRRMQELQKIHGIS